MVSKEHQVYAVAVGFAIMIFSNGVDLASIVGYFVGVGIFIILTYPKELYNTIQKKTDFSKKHALGYIIAAGYATFLIPGALEERGISIQTDTLIIWFIMILTGLLLIGEIFKIRKWVKL